MAISRSQMQRQLQNRGGITNLSPRQNFGLGSSLKKFARKIIPNEVSKIASTAAPFVAPFNPALAAGMAGIGSFDQSGSISDALKRGALTYGGGQAARYIGGADFQALPGTQDFGGLSGFTSFSSPIGDQTGLGKFFSDRRMPNTEIAEISEVAETGPKTFRESMADINLQRGQASAITPEYGDMLPNVYETASNVGPSIDVIKAETITKDPNFVSSVINKFQNQDYKGVGGEVLNAAKKVGKAVFYDKDGNLDKPVVLGTAAFALSFAEAKQIANEAGISDYTEAQYDEDQKAEKQAEYATYLTNFFGGQKDGGRIGYSEGTNNSDRRIKNLKASEAMEGKSSFTLDDLKDEGFEIDPDTVLVMIEGPNGVKIKEVLKSEALRDNLKIVSDTGDFPEDRKDGGRIGFDNGGIDMIALEENVMKYPEMVDEITNIEPGVAEAGEPVSPESTIFIKFDKEKEEADMLQEILRELEADGGRIGYDQGGRSGVIGKIADFFFDEEGNYSKALQRAKFEFSKFVSGMGTDLDTGAEWYNKLEPEEQKAIIEEKINYRQRTDDVPVYDERYAGTRGIGGNYADGGRIGLMSGSGGKKKYGQGIESAVKQIDPLQGGLDELKMGGGGGLPLAFTRLEKSFLFKNLAKLGGADRSFTMPQLYRILSNPSKFPKDSAALKAFLKIKGFSKGGDVGSVNEIPVRTNEAGVKELDYRQSGGFVPVGVKEKADDVPAMLSKNEFVLTADAVRGIGGGSVEKGSEKLYNVMKQAEQVGKA